MGGLRDKNLANKMICERSNLVAVFVRITLKSWGVWIFGSACWFGTACCMGKKGFGSTLKRCKERL